MPASRRTRASSRSKQFRQGIHMTTVKSLDDILLHFENAGPSEILTSPALPKVMSAAPRQLKLLRRKIRTLSSSEQQQAAAKLGAIVDGMTPASGQEALVLAQIAFYAGNDVRARRLWEAYGRNLSLRGWMLLDAALAARGAEPETAIAKAAAYANEYTVSSFRRPDPDKPNLYVLKQQPAVIADPRATTSIHFGGNLISQVVDRYPDRFNYASVFVDAAATERKLSMVPAPDLLVSNVVNGEALGDPRLVEATEAAIRHWNMPCINNPQAAAVTARNRLADLLDGCSDIVVPETVFYKRDDRSADDEIVAEIEKSFEYPVILRSPFFQNGINMELCQNREDAEHFLEQTPGGIFAIRFIENHPRPGLFRKLRAAFVGQDLHPLRLDYGEDWKVHGHRSEPHRRAFFEANPQLLEEEEVACRDFKTYVGETAMTALQRIRERIKLDCFGVDFDVADDGRLILFEANAAMNLLAKKGLAYPHPKFAEEAMLESYFALLDSRIGAQAG